MAEQRRITMAVTGAGGTRMARYVLSSLVKDDRVAHVDLMVSTAGRKLIACEFGGPASGDPVEHLLGGPHAKVSFWDPEKDIAGLPSSGSYPSWGMPDHVRRLGPDTAGAPPPALHAGRSDGL